MNKILLIIRREYLTRVKKKSFIVMTILGPLLIAAMYGIIFWLALNSDDLDKVKNIAVINKNSAITETFEDGKAIHFEVFEGNFQQAKDSLKTARYDYILHIPEGTPAEPLKGVELVSEQQPSLSVVSYIEKTLEDQVEKKKLIALGLDKKMLDNLKTNVEIETTRLTDTGEETGSTVAAFGIGMASGFLIYMFIFLYGVQVMRGVIEEKTSRIVEVIISSVRPYQLMLGKIIGIALVGLTQFLLWVVLTAIITGSLNTALMKPTSQGFDQIQSIPQQDKEVIKENKTAEIMSAINTLDFSYLLSTFLFYFLGGYLLYSALFAAIGSAVDNETETQQFMLPVTIPLIFSFIISTSTIIQNPDSTLAVWLSIIPLTSPIVMMVRIPFGVPAWQLALSMLSLVLGFIGTVWIAAKIYRTGILMYGKKASFKEIFKWLFIKG